MDDRGILTEERAARRYRQIAGIERALNLKAKELADAKQGVRDVQEDFDALLKQLRTAARDEGDLPLFTDLD